MEKEAKVIVAQQSVLIQTLGDFIRRCIESKFSHSSQDQVKFRLIVSGGTVTTFLNQIDTSFLKDWSNVWIYFADERVVPQQDEQCNCRALFEGNFIKTTKIPNQNIYCIDHSNCNDVYFCSNNYEERIIQSLSSHSFDLALLGIGEDGHTASLFPEMPVNNELRLVMPVFNAPKLPATRITLTLHALKTLCKEQIYIAVGRGKNSIVKKILAERTVSPQYPASLITPSLYLLDEESGHEINQQ